MGLRKLTLTPDQNGDLWEAVNTARASSTSVRVDKQALKNLLADHVHVLGEFEQAEIFDAEKRGGAR